jgi:hypothetical protein
MQKDAVVNELEPENVADVCSASNHINDLGKLI